MTSNPLADRRFGAILFDLDQTLLDSLDSLIAAWTTWAIEYNVTAEQFAGTHGLSSEALVQLLLPPDLVDGAFARINDLELAVVDQVSARPGAVELVSSLPAQRWAIATSCTRATMDARIDAAGLPRPSVLVCADDVTHAKPAPDLFLEAARRLGVPPEDCVVVEDAPNGIEAARAAGCAVIAVTSSTPRDGLTADLVVDSLEELVLDTTDAGIAISHSAGGRSGRQGDLGRLSR